MSGIRDLTRADIDFDINGRLEIKNKTLFEEIRKKLQKDGEIEIVISDPTGPPHPPPPNMCGCTVKVTIPRPVVGLGGNPPPLQRPK